MLRNTITIFMVFVLASVSGQVTFEKGYYISQNGKKVEGYVKNEEWSSSPKYIDFKSNLDSKEVRLPNDRFQEFGVYNQLKYKWLKIKEYDLILEESDNRKPKFVEKKVLLNTLVAGDVSLYEYNKTNQGKTFLLERKNGETLQLINFKVTLPTNQKVLFSTYKQDLKIFLNCNNSFLKKIENSTYRKEKIKNLVVDFNSCINGSSELFKLNSKKVKLYITPKLGFSANTLSLRQDVIDFSENVSGFGFLIANEFELSLPFKKRKVSVLIEPTYYSYSALLESAQYNSDGIEVSENGLQLGLGLRYYKFLNKNQLFLTVRYMQPLTFSREVDYSQFEDANDFGLIGSLNLGLGLRMNNKIYTELNLRVGANNTPKNNNLDMKYSSLSANVTVGYRLF